MKIIKINKSYRNGKKVHYLVKDDSISEEDIKDAVEEWCDNDTSGSVYGYSYSYSIVEDKEKIKDVLNKELSKIDSNIEYHNSAINELNLKKKKIKNILSGRKEKLENLNKN